ncbi:MAG TPA: flagellar filament capping protein FliD [Candidatus Sulfopaludibacter sp.]|jgi:flagellar capping protein FliD|nr:flagellar filament capping protein FliD [Candidatus Sulfopaludibacter sp.]
MSSSTSAIFTGSSQFSNDFQQVITRAVSIASLPMQQMQTTVAALQSQSSEMTTLKTDFTALQTAVNNLQSALGLGSYSAASSATTVASVALSGSPSAGTYSLEVDGLGSYARAMTNDGLATVADPAKTSISDSASFTLVVGADAYSITPASNTLQSLVDAINGQSDAGVQATIVDVGSSSAHDYRLSLQTTKYGELPLQLASDSGQTLLATSMSNDGLSQVADPNSENVSDASQFTLTVGASTYTITPDTGTLSGLADAINQFTDAGVQATVVNAGTDDAPDYRLSLQGASLSGQTIQLASVDGSYPGQALLSTSNGEPVTYRVNGKPDTAISSDTRTITISPGVQAKLLTVGTTDLTVSRNTDAVSSALSALATAYNTAQTEINKNRGSGTGALQGQSVLTELTNALHALSNYSSGSNGISSLTSLGVKFDATYAMTFDSSVFQTATSGQMAQLTSFLGSSTTGGFLQAATNALNTLTDSTSGVFATGVASLQDQITHDNNTISDQQDRITQLQDNLNAKMAAADAAIASMEQQYTYLSDMFAQMRVNSQNG